LESRLHLHRLDDKVMDTERRKAARKRLSQLAYIRFGADNGGLISDLGEGGLSFQSIAAIENEGPLRFWFTLDSDDRVQATGQLVWTDESRKVGGLRFTQISREALDVIQDWIERKEVQPVDRAHTREEVKVEAPVEVPLEPPAPPRQPARDPLRFSTPPRRSQPAAASAANLPKPEPAVARSQPNPPAAPAPRPEPLRVMAAPQRWSPPVLSEPPRSVVSPEMVSGITTGLTILAVVITVLVLGLAYRRELGHSLVDLGERLTGESPLAEVNPAPDQSDDPPADAAPSSATPADANPTNGTSTYTIPSKPAATTEFKQLPPPTSPSAAAKPVSTSTQDANGARAATPQPKPVASTQPQPAAPSPASATPAPVASNRPPSSTSTAGFQNLSASNRSAADSGDLELETARQFLEAPTGQRKSTEAAKWLWMSVEKGNPKAEVLLADLFLHGDGVAKNCAQARILFGAAIKHGDSEAVSKLHALDRGGCR
jgi:hypothetical protein